MSKETEIRNPLVSIIIPTFNRGSLLTESLKSVKGQTYHDWECIVVDDGSSDDTQAIVEKFSSEDSRFRLVFRPASLKKGANSCRNYGLLICRGSYVKWLDSDDLMNGECLKKQTAVLADTDADVCFCNADFFKDEGGQLQFIPDRVWGKLRPIDEREIVSEYLRSGLKWQTACGLWRKKFLPEKPFLEGLQNSQEWLMHLTLLLLQPKRVYTEEKLIHVRIHYGSMSNSSNKKGLYYYHQCISRIEALEKLQSNGQLTTPIFTKLLRFILWNQLFTFYKGAIGKGLSFFRFYPTIITSSLNRAKTNER